ncbi:unnamed protein product [Arctogadus glacialis]
MDPILVLGQQSQNKIQSDYTRLKNEENRIPGDSKPSKNETVPQFLKKDVENKTPGSIGNGQKTTVKPGSSRLPVLAKSLNLQISKEFAQFHKSWEDKPLAGKTKSKQPCTKPMPFNFSQPRSKGTAPQNQRVLRTLTPRDGSDENTLNSRYSKGNNVNGKTPRKEVGVDFASQLSIAQKLATRKPESSVIQALNRDLTERMETLKGTGPSSAVSSASHAIKPMTSSKVSVQPDAKTMHQYNFAASAQVSASQASTEACLNNLDLLSIKDPYKKRTLQAAVAASSSSGSDGKEEVFNLDHAALLSILRNKGVGAKHVGVATPESTKPCNYQRISVMKSHAKAGATPVGPMRVAVHSLDPAAMRSTMHREGVKAGGALEKTPSRTACQTGRETSVNTARRVPVTSRRGESGTPAMKGTPQRVPNTRNQPMSAMASVHKKVFSARPVSHNLPACPSEPQHEDVVQRLFEDQDDEENMAISGGPESHADQLADLASTKAGVRWADGGHRAEEAEGEQEEKKGGAGQGPFLQEPHRESVIFFSTGKKLLRAPRVEKPSGPVQSGPVQSGPVQSGPVQSVPEREVSDAQRATAPGPVGERPEFDIPALGKHFASSLQRDFLIRKTCAAASPAVALLLKRRLLLDELRLDEEVATYIGCSAPDTQSFLRPRPRCGNPLAAFMYFQDSTTFVPVGCEGSPGSASPSRER